MPLAHMPATEAAARMLHDASIVTSAGGFGVAFGLVVFGLPLLLVSEFLHWTAATEPS